MKKTILIIDDSLPIRYLLEVFFSKKYNIVSASDGLSGMAWLTKGNVPDMIITDLQMPNISGWELVEYLNASNLYKDIPVMVLTGVLNPKDSLGHKTFDNVKAICNKPFDPVQLMDAVDRIVNNTYNVVYS